MSEFLTANSLPLLAMLATAAFLWKMRPSKGCKTPGNSHAASLQKLRSSGAYWGVTIKPGKCAAAQQFGGKKFPLDNVPIIPLAGCKAWRCTCVYVGLRERRKLERRRVHDRRDAVRFDAAHPDRRTRKNRRRGDGNWIDADR
jgi:hypothetical protein